MDPKPTGATGKKIIFPSQNPRIRKFREDGPPSPSGVDRRRRSLDYVPCNVVEKQALAVAFLYSVAGRSASGSFSVRA